MAGAGPLTAGAAETLLSIGVGTLLAACAGALLTQEQDHTLVQKDCCMQKHC